MGPTTIPSVVSKLFESQRGRITRFAKRNNLILHDEDDGSNPDGICSWYLRGTLWGRGFHINIRSNPELARIEHFEICLVVRNRDLFVTECVYDLLDLEPSLLAGTDEFLDEALKEIGRFAVKVVRNLPWNPRQPRSTS
jgi:hypothetical protein